MKVMDLILANFPTISKREAAALIKQGGFKVNGRVITIREWEDVNQLEILPRIEDEIQIGKHKIKCIQIPDKKQVERINKVIQTGDYILSQMQDLANITQQLESNIENKDEEYIEEADRVYNNILLKLQQYFKK